MTSEVTQYCNINAYEEITGEKKVVDIPRN